jgi:hypothetical protein
MAYLQTYGVVRKKIRNMTNDETNSTSKISLQYKAKLKHGHFNFNFHIKLIHELLVKTLLVFPCEDLNTPREFQEVEAPMTFSRYMNVRSLSPPLTGRLYPPPPRKILGTRFLLIV